MRNTTNWADMGRSPYRWMVVDRAGQNWTSESWKIKIREVIGRDPEITRVIFFAEQAPKLPRVEFTVEPDMTLILYEYRGKGYREGALHIIPIHKQVIGYANEMGRFELSIDLETGVVEMRNCNIEARYI